MSTPAAKLIGVCLLVLAWTHALLAWTHALSAGEPTLPSGDAVIRAPAGGSQIEITTTSRLAGAIHSLTWNGMEFIDSVDHGRQLQSASNLDLGTPIRDETYNPTEAGSRDDGAGPTSTSRLLHLTTTDRSLQTTTQMAFWLPPGGESGGFPAKNTQALSNHLLTKRVTIGYRDLPHVIDYRVTFHLPIGEFHTRATFEAVTGYMPIEFSVPWGFDSAEDKLVLLPAGQGEQPLPVVLATANGSHAMGVYSPYPGAGYGRFRFDAAHVTKWNCVFRVHSPTGLEAGEYVYPCYVVVGDLATVEQSIRKLRQYHPPQDER